MRFAIKHEIPGRIRFDLQGKIPEHDAIALEETFLALPCVTKCVAYPKAGSLSVAFEGVGKAELALARTTIVSKLKALTYKEVKAWEPENSLMLAPRPRHLFTQIANMIVFRAMRRWFLPVPLRLHGLIQYNNPAYISRESPNGYSYTIPIYAKRNVANEG